MRSIHEMLYPLAALTIARAKRKHTVVVSDVHLSQAHPDDDADPLWMRYRRRAFHPDADFAALVDRLLLEIADDELELVFNGDVLDFDAPWVKDGDSSFDEVHTGDASSAAHARRIMADHTVWFGAVARALVRGHGVLFTSGNHDVELGWPGVRAAIREELVELAVAEGARARVEVDRDRVGARIRFRTWFHVTEDRIYIEHGSQYDVFNNWRHAMTPYTLEGDAIHPNLGKLAFRRTGGRMGYFNPYYEETFYISPHKTLLHFLRFYAFTKRDIARTWLFGALSTLRDIVRARTRYSPTHVADAHALAQRETGASLEVIEATHALGARPAEVAMLPIARELWIDRFALLFFMGIAFAVVVALASVTAGAITAGALVALFVLYEIATPKPDIRTYDSAPPEVVRILDIHDVRAMCLGHTHRPFGRWDERSRFYGNSGSWCPAFHDQLCEKPILDGRPFLWLTTHGDRLWGGLHFWRAGTIEREEGATKSEEDDGAANAARTDGVAA